VQTAAASGSGAASTEFVEIYNPGDCIASFVTVKLAYRSDNDNPGGAGFTGALTIAAGAYAVLGTTDYAGTKNGTLVSGLAAGAGQLAIIRKSDSSVIDAVAWGNIQNGTFQEGLSAAAPGAGKSLARTPNGTDTGHNRTDFAVATTPTPGAAN
jgi:hypothetical protein